jgi:hypothetical protein
MKDQSAFSNRFWNPMNPILRRVRAFALGPRKMGGSFLLLLSTSVLLASTPAHGQSACGQLGVDCKHPSTPQRSTQSSQPIQNSGPSHEAVQRAQAAAADQKGLEASNRGDWEEAANRFLEALKLAPDSTAIRAHLDRATIGLADSKSAARIAALHQRIQDAIQAANLKALRLRFYADITRSAERHYTPAGNGLIGGTAWVVYASREPGKPAKRMCDQIKQQAKLAGSALDASVDCEHYDFVLGMAISLDKFTDLKNRVAFDDLTNGQFSAHEQGLYDKLRGKQFAELGCHSNGAMLCLAALENADVKADHVVLYGPQVTRESLRMWDQLVRTGKVHSVKVYLNENDMVPELAIAYADQIGGVLDVRDLPLFAIGSLKRTINEASPRLLVQTFPCSRDRFSFECHFLEMYKLKVNCTGKSSGKAVPGTGLHGKDDLPEPSLPCEAIGSKP